MRFIVGVRGGGSTPEALASVAGYSGVLTWPEDLLEGNRSAIYTPVYEKPKEIPSFVVAIPSLLDVHVWRSK